MSKLKGKSVIVTGASRGIGRATAKMLAAAGASVFLVAEGTREELEAAVAECFEAGAPRAEYGIFDLAGSAVPQRVADAALRAMGRIDVLVNNAGIRIHGPFGEFVDADFERLIAINLRAPFMLSQAVLPAMREQGGGRIVHVASQLGSVATPGAALYGMAKAALIHLTKSMALELAKEGIMVNAVSPGPTETETMHERWTKGPELREQRLAEIPLERFGKPEEIAAAILFLATTDAQFIQGHNLVIDGGYTLH
ncbi:MAG: glucose 1-dehydrogenase [Burkholderiales bacterium]|nr:glucose 1-dehydrogenase [Burkholderiales bacterium]